MKPAEINRRAYGLGVEAGRGGKSMADCPYTRLEYRTSWKHGMNAGVKSVRSDENTENHNEIKHG